MCFLGRILPSVLVKSWLCVVDKSFVFHSSLRKHLAVWNEITKSWRFLGHKSFLLLDDGLFIAACNCLHAPGRTQITVWIIKIEPALPLVKYCSIAPKDLPMKTLSWSPTAVKKNLSQQPILIKAADIILYNNTVSVNVWHHCFSKWKSFDCVTVFLKLAAFQGLRFFLE